MNIQNSSYNIERNNKAIEMIREAKIANFAKLAKMLIELFGIPEAFKKYVKPEREGQEIELEFPSIQGSITVVLTRDKEKFYSRYGKPSDPVATLVINVKREKAALLLGHLISKKNNIFGILSLVPKLILRKIKIKGSIGAVFSLARILMIGKHNVYKNI